MKHFWIVEEDEILKKLWLNEKIMDEDIMKVFPRRTWGAIIHRAGKLGLPWRRPRKAEMDFEYLKKLRETVEI